MMGVNFNLREKSKLDKGIYMYDRNLSTSTTIDIGSRVKRLKIIII